MIKDDVLAFDCVAHSSNAIENLLRLSGMDADETRRRLIGAV